MVEPGEFIPPDGVFLLATDAGEPVGCGGIRRFDDTTAELKRLFVRAEHRGTGAGHALLDRAEQEARDLGYVRLDEAVGRS